jgi:glutamine synthetase
MNDQTLKGEVAMDLSQIEKLIKEKDLKTIIVGTPDTNGNFRGRGVNPDHFLKTICDEGLGICDCIYNMDTLDRIHLATRELPWYPSWEDGFRDYIIHPDLSTFGLVPWLDRTAAVIGDVYDQNTGEPLVTAPRSVLKKVVQRADQLGYRIVATTELEFIVFPESINDIAVKGFRDITRLSPGAYDYSCYRLAVHKEFIDSIVDNMNLRGIPIHTFQVEAAGGQFECQLLHCDILEAADRAFIYKSGVKELVARQGMTATFMAKYDSDDFGSSCHVHQSVVDKETGRNLFWDQGREESISQLMAYYAGGLLSVMKEFTLMWAPYVNSYKRLGVDTAAGINKRLSTRTPGSRG